MQYEIIILELMSRIKMLEEDVSAMKMTLHALETSLMHDEGPDAENDLANAPIADSVNASGYMKMTQRMMDVCYVYGKKAYLDPGANAGAYADAAAAETNMNRNSAFMYICAVKNMLEGKVFKRAVSAKAMRRYFDAIYNDFGKAGLAKAIAASRANAEYRQKYDLPATSTIALCEEFQKKL